MNGKGQSTIPFTVIEAATTMLILLGLAYGTQAETNEFVKEETLTLQVDRVTNAALALNSVPQGFIELDMDGYGIKYEDSELTMNYSDTSKSSTINESMTSYDGGITGPDNVTTVNGSLCLQKSEFGRLEIRVGEC